VKLFLDTSVLIDHLRGHEAATSWLSEQVNDGAELWSVTLVRTEILAGMRPNEKKLTLALLGIIQWQEVSIELADYAGALANRFLKSHPGVDTVDYVIAAGCEAMGATLCTRNTKHFPMFAKLRAPYAA